MTIYFVVKDFCEENKTGHLLKLRLIFKMITNTFKYFLSYRFIRKTVINMSVSINTMEEV